MMRVGKARILVLMAAAAVAGLTGNQFVLADSLGLTNSLTFGPTGIAGTDDTGPNETGNAVNYTGMLLQTYGATSAYSGISENGTTIGAGGSYIVGTLQLTTLTGAHSSSTATTAFYLDPVTNAFHYFGQFSPTSTLQYQNNAATTSFNGIPNQSTYFHSCNIYGVSGNGNVMVSQGIEATDSTSNSVLGRHAYLYNIPTNTYTSLGLTGVTPDSTGASYSVNFNYSNTSATTSQGVFATSNAGSTDNQGDAGGTSNRYFAFNGTTTSTLSALGSSAYYMNPATKAVTVTGLYGPGYSYNKTIAALAGAPTSGGTGTFATNIDKGVNNGYQIGTATPYIDNGLTTAGTSLGTEIWESYKGAPATAISLYQSGLSPNVQGFESTPFAYSYTVSGTSTTGQSRSSSVIALASSGKVAGTSTYYNGSSSSKGTDAWIYTPGAVTPYQQVGLVSNGFMTGGTSSFVSLAGQRTSNVAYMNNAGNSVGTSTQFLSSAAGGNGSTGTTTVAWYTPAGGTTVQIGPVDQYHTAVSATLGSFLSDTITNLTQSGLIAGTSPHYIPGTTTTNGTDPWLFDPSTGKYFIIDPYYANPGYSNFTGSLTYLGEDGTALGTYSYNGSATHAFMWSEATGAFTDLATSVVQTDPNFTTITTAYSYNSDTHLIYAQGKYVDGNGVTQSPGGGVEVIAAVPEPTSMAVIGGITALGCLRRRRRAM